MPQVGGQAVIGCPTGKATARARETFAEPMLIGSERRVITLRARSLIANLAPMVSSNCALCNTPLTASNDSAEHVIANAIGGIWAIRGFICKPCNDTTGQNWDAELAAQLNGLCHFFAIKRDRGAIPVETI